MNKMKVFFKVLFLSLLSYTGVAQQKSSVTVEAFEKGIQAKDVQILDVRRPEEFKEGHLRGAVLANWQNEEHFATEVKKLDKKKPVYLYCLSGVRSSKAANWLVEQGFTQVVSLDGGIKAWKEAKKPVERTP